MVCPNCNTESGSSLFCYVCDAYLPSKSGGVKASLPSRFGAFLLDVFVFLTTLLVIGLIAFGAGVRVYGLQGFLPFFFGGLLGYFLLIFWFLARGQTPGKWLMDIRAVDKRNGAEPGLGRMLFRETLGKWVSGCFLGLGWFWAIWDRDAQTWHDKISRTVVLYRRTQSRKFLFLYCLLGAAVLSVALAWDVIIDNRLPNAQSSNIRPPNAQFIATEHAFTGDFAIERAFTALFGNYDPSSQSSSVTVTGGNSDSSSHRGKLTLILDRPFSQRGVQKHLLVTSTTVEGEEAHVDAARLGAYLFAARAGQWISEIGDREVDWFGAFGHAFGIPDRDHPNGADVNDGNAQAVKFAADVYGFSLTHGDGGQGIWGQFELFVAPVKNHYQPVLSLDIEGDNAMDCGPTSTFQSPCYGYKSKVRFLNSVHADFFDIEVDRAGTTKNSNGVVIPANQKTVYFFSGDKYVEQASSVE
jgi:uncharacterized RDD family membrane protein YckC